MSSSRPLRILIVDDSADDAFFTSRLLASAGYRAPFPVAASCEGAIGLLSARDGGNVGLVFLDIHMPQADGFELLRWIRAQSALARVRVIMLSTSNRPEDITRAREMGADGYVVKNPSPEKLRAILCNIDRALLPPNGPHDDPSFVQSVGQAQER